MSSFLRRLAKANHIRNDELADYLRLRKPWAATPTLDVRLEALAIVTEIDPVGLAHALPEIRYQLTDQSLLRVLGRVTAKDPNRTRWACRRCMAAKNITSRVTVWARRDQNVCLRHQLWIGEGVGDTDDQVEVADLPEISQAQTRLHNIIRRHGLRRVGYFYLPAQEIIAWSTDSFSDSGRRNRKRYLFTRERAKFLPWSYDFAAYYPEVVALLSVLASPYWRRLAISEDPVEQEKFYRQATANDLTSGNPARNTPLRKWMERHRLKRSPDDPDGENFMQRWDFGPSGAVEPTAS